MAGALVSASHGGVVGLGLIGWRCWPRPPAVAAMAPLLGAGLCSFWSCRGDGPFTAALSPLLVQFWSYRGDALRSSTIPRCTGSCRNVPDMAYDGCEALAPRDSTLNGYSFLHYAASCILPPLNKNPPRVRSPVSLSPAPSASARPSLYRPHLDPNKPYPC